MANTQFFEPQLIMGCVPLMVELERTQYLLDSLRQAIGLEAAEPFTSLKYLHFCASLTKTGIYVI